MINIELKIYRIYNIERKISDSKMNNIINNKNFHYLYVDRDGNPNNYDESTFENMRSSILSSNLRKPDFSDFFN